MGTVLVVEDDRVQRQILSKLLQSIGANVVFANNGVEALSLAESYCPELVILDIIMPQMNGYEVCRRLKAKEKHHKPTVLMYSNKAEECDFYWGSKQGADAYVSKLCHHEELLNTVQSLLREEI
jgi:twitching motility two-component system response regulator PilH